MSVLNVVATIDTPTSHHGAARPEVKNSAVLDPARRASHTAGTNETTIETTTMTQSSAVSCTAPSHALHRRHDADVPSSASCASGRA